MWSKKRLQAAGETWLAIGLCLIAAALLTYFVLDDSTARVATEFLILVGMVIGIQVFVGNSGILSFGHLSFFAVGAYAVALSSMPPQLKAFQTHTLPAPLRDGQYGFAGCLVFAVAAGGLWAIITGAFVARMKTSAIAMATLALLIVSYNVVNAWDGVTNGNQGLAGIPQLTTLGAATAISIVITGFALLFAASPMGLRLQATREDEAAAQALGVGAGWPRFWGWLLSGILVTLAGAVWALNARAIAPGQFYFEETFALLAMLVVGGIRSVSGAFVGTLVMTTAIELIRQGQDAIAAQGGPTLPGLVQLSTAVIIIVVLIVRPQGLVGTGQLRIPLVRSTK